MDGTITKNTVRRLAEIVGEVNVITDPDRLEAYSHDEFALSEIARIPGAVVRPASTEETSAVMRLADQERIPVTPRGGATGLCGGCVPSPGGLVLSLERMNRIVEIDTANQMAVVEAGVPLMDFYTAVKEAGLYFPPHPGDESAVFGGLVATNAGGARAVKYGVIRNYILGLDVVLPTGRIIHPGGKLMKSSTGYNLVHLLIGSEGTLGVITRVVVRLMPIPPASRSLIVPYDRLEDAIETVPLFIRRGILPLAVEFIPKDVVRITERMLNKSWPSPLGHYDLLIILDAASDREMDGMSEAVAEVCLEKNALDVFVADSSQKQEQVLAIRSKMYESIKDNNIETLDIVVPRAEIAGHLEKVREIERRFGLWLPTYGHAADGNVHTHIMSARLEDGEIQPVPKQEWADKIEKIRDALYRDARVRGGKISGEHGIGLVKKHFLSVALDEAEIDLMRGIKKVFDPRGILNPGKIFD